MWVDGDGADLDLAAGEGEFENSEYARFAGLACIAAAASWLQHGLRAPGYRTPKKTRPAFVLANICRLARTRGTQALPAARRGRRIFIVSWRGGGGRADNGH